MAQGNGTAETEGAAAGAERTDGSRPALDGSAGPAGSAPHRSALAFPIVAAVVLSGLGFGFGLPWWAALAGFAVLVAGHRWAARPPAGRRIGPVRTSRRPVWPDGGMRILAEGLTDPCILTDAAGTIRFANRHAAARFGALAPGEPLALKLRVTGLHDAIARVGAGGAAETVDWSERVPAERWLRARVGPIALPAGPDTRGGRDGAPPDFVLVVVEDLTEQRRAERMRVDFVANASHELRTPLASLTGFIDTLIGPAREDPAARDRFLAIMAGQAARMKRLIDDLLSLSRIEMKAHMQPDTPVDLRDVVGHVAEALGPLGREAGMAIVWSPPGEPAVVLGERDELVQVFANLVENAIKYGEGGDRVELAARRDDDHWAVAVVDHGPGIAAEHIPRLTERFYRADAAASRARQGTGLGLAIVKHILARHRGRLGIESRLGSGSTFTVRLPASAPAETADRTTAVARGGGAEADRGDA